MRSRIPIFLFLLVFVSVLQADIIILTDDKNPEKYCGIWIKNLALSSDYDGIIEAFGSLDNYLTPEQIDALHKRGEYLSLCNDIVLVPDYEKIGENEKIKDEISEFLDSLILWSIYGEDVIKVPFSQKDKYLLVRKITLKSVDPASDPFPVGQKEFDLVVQTAVEREHLFEQLRDCLYEKKELAESLESKKKTLAFIKNDQVVFEGIKNISDMLDSFDASYDNIVGIFADPKLNCTLKRLILAKLQMNMLLQNPLFLSKDFRSPLPGEYHAADVYLSLADFQNMINTVSPAESDESIIFAQKYLALLNVVVAISGSIEDFQKKIPNIYSDVAVFKITSVKRTITKTDEGYYTQDSAQWAIARVQSGWGIYRLIIPTRSALEEFYINANDLGEKYGNFGVVLKEIEAQISKKAKQLVETGEKEKRLRGQMPFATDGWRIEDIDRLVNCLHNLTAGAKDELSGDDRRDFFINLCLYRRDLAHAIGIPPDVMDKVQNWYGRRQVNPNSAPPATTGGAFTNLSGNKLNPFVIELGYDDLALVMGGMNYIPNNNRENFLFEDAALTKKISQARVYMMLKVVKTVEKGPNKRALVICRSGDGTLQSGWMDAMNLPDVFLPKKGIVKTPDAARVRETPPTDLVANNFAQIRQADSLETGTEVVILQEFAFMWNGVREGWYYIEYSKEGEKRFGWAGDVYFNMTGEY